MSTTILEVESPQNFEFPFNPLIDPIEDIYQHLLDKNIIDKKETYIYLVGNMGGTVDQNQGTFQLAPNFMYKLSNGKATLLKRCSFSGKTLSVLSSIVKASNQKSRDTGMCGKLGQSVPDVGKAPSLTLIDKNKEITLS
jgi:predicted Zn-dependent protease